MASHETPLAFSFPNSLLYPFWNHWWFLQYDWLSAVWFLYESHYFFALNHICSKLHHSCSKINHIIFVLNRTIFALYNRIISVSNTKLDVKAFLFPAFQQTAYLINRTLVLTVFCDFKNGCNKVVLDWTSCRAILVWNNGCDSNRTRAARSSYFEITHMISDQIALHSI